MEIKQVSGIYIEKEGFEEYFNISYKDDMLEYIYRWVRKKYGRNSTNRDLCSFASLIEYFSTGWYGGYGAELYEKERSIEMKTRNFYTKLEKDLSNKEKSIELIKFIEDQYFGQIEN